MSENLPLVERESLAQKETEMKVLSQLGMVEAIVHNPPQDDHETGDMKEGTIDGEQAVVAHDQAPEVSEPGVGALNDPATPVAPQRSTVLRGRTNAILLVRTDQLDSATLQTIPLPRLGH